MVSSVVFLVLLVVEVYGLPQFVIPDLDVSPPEEINSLSLNRFRSRSIDVSPQKTVNNNNNFDDTIKEVEDILKTNPALPRLTRGEILDLLENITQTDLVKSQLLKNGKIERDPKAIMVVMPFTPSNDNNMQDLYTKPPVTHIIGGEPFTKPVSNKTGFKRRTTTTTTSTTTEKPRRFSTKKPFVPRGIEKKQRQKQEYTTITSTTSITSTSTSPPTFRSRTRGTPIRRRRPTSTKPTIKYNNHRYPEENENQQGPNPGFHVVKPPNLSEPDMEVQEDTKSENIYNGQSKIPHVFVTPLTDSPPIYHGTSPKKPLPTSFSIITTTQKPREFEIVTAPASVEDLNIPQHLSGVVKDMNLGAAMSGNIPTIKPMPDFKVPDDTEKIKAMLESLGIYTPTTTTGIPDVKYMADNLSPDMKDLLMNFGLIPNPNEKPAVKVPEPNPEKAEITPDSFVGFKPLPEDSASRSEMEELLASFGLGRSSRREKSISEPKTKKGEQELSFEAVPEEYRGLLKDIGLRQGRKIRTGEVEKTLEKQHIFNPTDSKYASEEELGKLGKLIDMIRELEKLNRTVTDEDLKKLDLETLKELLSSLNQSEGPTPLNEQNPGPNPVDFDFGLSKNEVKRQQSTTEKVEVVESTNVQIVEEEERKPSIKDLEDSFGGETTTTTTTEPPSTTRRTGFYYLVDWNTFLDIDDQKGKRVNLRFQPKIGDPKRFYSVTVP